MKANYEHGNAKAYDNGDGKIGNYAVPSSFTIKAKDLYFRLKNNRHYHVKYGLPEREIMERLNSHDGNVSISQHKNGGDTEIYRINFI